MKRRTVTSRIGQLFRWTAVVVIGGLFFFSIIVWFNIQRSFPHVDGQARFQGIDGEIEIIRDIDGVPHIYADTAHDLMFAQGFVEAQDRYWQMDFLRHVGNGELSEMFGADQLETDQFLRTLGWGEIADREARALPSDVAEYVDSYAQGVNEFSGDRRGGELSFEHFVLRLIARGYSPDPWTPADTLAFTKVMAWDLSGNLDEEIERSILAATMPINRIEELYPAYPSDNPIIAPTGLNAVVPDREPMPIGLAAPGLGGLLSSLDSLDTLLGDRGPEIGSNNWAVSGELTSSGLPMLANDPHLGISMPSIWYEVGLHCRQVTESCPFNVVGFSFPGAPGVVIGHNADIAWGVTNLNPDEMDLYVEKINPANPNQYEYMGEWIDMDVRTETIVVAGGESERLVIRSTIHGPIISDSYESLQDLDTSPLAGRFLDRQIPDEYAVSMAWTALDESTIVEAILGINLASDWSEFREAAAKWDIAAQNLVYADIEGNIGYQSTGRIPIRTEGDGRWPVPGWTGVYEWDGSIPFEEMPSMFNPARGYVASANQPLVDDTYPHHIHDDVSYGYRADRIETLLQSADGPLDAVYFRMMQSDARSAAAEITIPHIIGLESDSEAVELAKEVFGAWSFAGTDPLSQAYQMKADTPGAALFASFWRHLMIETFHDDLPEEVYPDGGGRWFRVIETLLPRTDAAWWDNADTDEVEGRDDMLVRALEAAIEELGDDPQQWDWTEMHTATFANASLGESGVPPLEWILNRSGHRVSGGSSLINATSWDAADDTYDVTVIPSMRMIIDLSNLSASTAIHTTGQSGHPNHEHYDDMIERWIANDPHPMRWTRDDVQDAEKNTLIIFPIR